MKFITKIAAVLFAYFCNSITYIFSIVLIPWCILIHLCLGGAEWRTRRSYILNNAIAIAHITPPLTWLCVGLSIMVFWGKILSRYFLIEDNEKIANVSIILSIATILPIVIWWVSNQKSIMDLKINLRVGERHRILWSILSLLFFILQLSMPFIMLCI